MRSSFKSFPTNYRGPQAPPPAKNAVKALGAKALFPVRIGCLSVLLLAASLHAQTTPAASQPAPQPSPEAAKASISLSPAVIMAKGSFGQGLTQTLTISNQTLGDLSFDLVAEDVIIKDGKRVFVPAGETPNSIAATAVFSHKTVLVKPFTSAAVDVRLTIPAQTDLRAIVAVFRGTDKLQTSSDSVGMTASLGTLITFNLTGNVKLQPEVVRVSPATDSANMTIAQWIANTGAEPALPEGTAAVLNAGGSLVGKATFAPQRLLPGERLEFSAEYPAELAPGKYRALCSFQFAGQTMTSQAGFDVPKK